MSDNKTIFHTGKVTGKCVNKYGQLTGYYIEAEGRKFFAHLGDLKDTEVKLYDLRDSNQLLTLNEHDAVEFEEYLGEPTKHALHVKKI